MPDSKSYTVADFSENYSFVLQDAAQGFHWNNAQATMHPFVRNRTSFSKEAHLVLEKALSSFPAKMMNLSDSAASSQYKNQKNFTNLCHHQADYNAAAEWHFSATPHGKGARAGLGGTSSQSQLTKATHKGSNYDTFFNRISGHLPNIPGRAFDCCSTEEYGLEKGNLETRFNNCQTIPSTRRLALFHTTVTRHCGNLAIFSLQYISTSESEQVFCTFGIRGSYRTAFIRSQWWVAQVLNRDD